MCTAAVVFVDQIPDATDGMLAVGIDLDDTAITPGNRVAKSGPQSTADPQIEWQFQDRGPAGPCNLGGPVG
mgnify:CR=1 FL=1